MVPLHVIKDNIDGYIAEGHIASHEKDQYAQAFEEMLGVHRESDLHAAPESDGGSTKTAEPDEEHRQLTEAELQRELEARASQMQSFQGWHHGGSMANIQRSHSMPSLRSHAFTLVSPGICRHGEELPP